MFERFFTPYQASTAVLGDRIAILAPHPDDEIFGCGGSAIKWQAQGKTVQAFILTSGVVDGEFNDQPNPEHCRAEKAKQRADESYAAAALLGFPAPIFLNRQDGGLVHDNEIEAMLLEQLQSWQPTTLVVPSIWEMHRDHRATAELGLALAQQLASVQQLAMYEVGVPLSPNVLEDISPQQARKWQAMQCFPSQLQAQHYAEQIRGLNQYRSYTLGLNITQAEAFCCVPASELSEFDAHFEPNTTTQSLIRAEQSNHEHAQQISELQQRITQLHNSLSWRITQPLRWLRAKF
ncbi:MAG: PIG-L family deacetylase [Marinomonas atlantica]|nr:PIG-L family deacetylase [Marinomonas atlantica]